MNKLTAERCRERIIHLSRAKRMLGVSMAEDDYLEALEIALPVLELQEKAEHDFIRMRDLLKKHQSEANHQIDSDGWIAWGGGEQPCGSLVEIKFRSGKKCKANPDNVYWWNSNPPSESDIIAYRVVEQQERKRGEEE